MKSMTGFKHTFSLIQDALWYNIISHLNVSKGAEWVKIAKTVEWVWMSF